MSAGRTLQPDVVRRRIVRLVVKDGDGQLALRTGEFGVLMVGHRERVYAFRVFGWATRGTNV
jgi:hypothetical protein